MSETAPKPARARRSPEPDDESPAADQAPPSAPPEPAAELGPVKVYNRHCATVGGVPAGQSRTVERSILAAYPWALRAEG